MAALEQKTVRFLSEKRRGKVGERMVYFTGMGRRDLVDETGLVGGIYMNTAKQIARVSGLLCEGEEDCKEPVIVLESRLIMAIDNYFDVYRREELLVEDPDIVDLLDETNLRILICLKHKKVRMERL